MDCLTASSVESDLVCLSLFRVCQFRNVPTCCNLSMGSLMRLECKMTWVFKAKLLDLHFIRDLLLKGVWEALMLLCFYRVIRKRLQVQYLLKQTAVVRLGTTSQSTLQMEGCTWCKNLLINRITSKCSTVILYRNLPHSPSAKRAGLSSFLPHAQCQIARLVLARADCRELQMGLGCYKPAFGRRCCWWTRAHWLLHFVREAPGHGWAISAGVWELLRLLLACQVCCIAFVLFPSGITADVSFCRYFVYSGPNLWLLLCLQFCSGPGFCMLSLLLHACCLLLAHLFQQWWLTFAGHKELGCLWLLWGRLCGQGCRYPGLAPGLLLWGDARPQALLWEPGRRIRVANERKCCSWFHKQRCI